MPRFTRSSVEAVRDAVDMVDLVVCPHGAAQGRRAQLRRHLPVPRGAQPVVQRRARREALPLLRLPGGRRRVPLRAGDGGRRVQRGGRAAGAALRRAGRGRGGGSAGGRRAGRPGAGSTSSWSAPRRSTCATCGTRPRRSTPGNTSLGRGLQEATLREFRVGYAPDRVGQGADGVGAQRVLGAGDPRRGPVRAGSQRRLVRPLPRAGDVPPVRPARARARLRGARAGRGDRREVREHRPRATSSTRAARCSAPISRGPAPLAPGASSRWRATPTSSRCTRRGCATASASWGRR